MPLPNQIVATYADPAVAGSNGLAYDAGRNRLFAARPLANVIAQADLAGAVPLFTPLGFSGSNPAAEGLAVPLALAVEGAGHLLVLDSGNNELDRYSCSAAGVYTYDPAFLGGGRHDLGGMALAQPTDLVLHGTTAYVLDSGNSRVVTVDLGTGVSATLISDPSWNQASGLAVRNSGEVLIADTFNHRILKYPAGGGAPTVIGSHGTAVGQLRIPRGLALDATGNLFVADSGNQRVQVFDPTDVSIGMIGDATVFSSIRGLTFDGTGRLYASDASRNTITVFATAAAGPILRLEGTVFEFGSVGMGYALDRPLRIHNDGTGPLSVTSVSSSNSRFIPSQTTFQVPAGGAYTLMVRFSPSAPGFETGILTVTSDSVAGASAGVVERGTGITPPLVDAMLVLDRSGSMSQSIGGQSKMSALKSAADLFVDLARAGSGDRLGVVDFDHIATIGHPLTAVTDTPPSSRAEAKAAIDALTPRGSTSIGGGMEKAHEAFSTAGVGTGRRVMVVVTDGMENRAPFVFGGSATDPHVDLTQFAGITMYTVGLGLGNEVDLGVLTSLASTFRGSFYLTEDRWFTLPKFFIEIFGDTLSEFVTLDPEYTLIGPDPSEVTVDLSRMDTGVTFALYWKDADLELELRLVTPAGRVIDPGVLVKHPEIRFAKGRGYAFFRMRLPLAGPLGKAWEGSWRIVVSAPKLGRGKKAAFGLSVLVSSNLGITCELVRDSDGTGEALLFEAALTKYGMPVLPDRVTLSIDAPAHSRGTLLSGHGSKGKKDASADYARATNREHLAWAVEHDAQFRSRDIKEVKTDVHHENGSVVLRGTVPCAAVEGSYHYRLITELHSGGLRLRREFARSFLVVAYPSRDKCKVTFKAIGAKVRHHFQFRMLPRDAMGNLLGPDLASEMTLRCVGGRATRIKDERDGSYSVGITVRKGREHDLQVLWRIRGCDLRWTWDDLTNGQQTTDANKEGPPRTYPKN